MMSNKSRTSITIKLDRPNSLFIASEVISGTINLYIDERQIKVHEIFMTFKGKISYKTINRFHSKSLIAHPSMPIYHQVPIFSTTTFFVGSPSGKNEFIYYRGQYSQRFQIHLPDYLPPTITDPYNYPYIQYYLKLVLFADFNLIIPIILGSESNPLFIL